MCKFLPHTMSTISNGDWHGCSLVADINDVQDGSPVYQYVGLVQCLVGHLRKRGGGIYFFPLQGTPKATPNAFQIIGQQKSSMSNQGALANPGDGFPLTRGTELSKEVERMCREYTEREKKTFASDPGAKKAHDSMHYAINAFLFFGVKKALPAKIKLLRETLWTWCDFDELCPDMGRAVDTLADSIQFIKANSGHVSNWTPSELEPLKNSLHPDCDIRFPCFWVRAFHSFLHMLLRGGRSLNGKQNERVLFMYLCLYVLRDVHIGGRHCLLPLFGDFVEGGKDKVFTNALVAAFGTMERAKAEIQSTRSPIRKECRRFGEGGGGEPDKKRLRPSGRA